MALAAAAPVLLEFGKDAAAYLASWGAKKLIDLAAQKIMSGGHDGGPPAHKASDLAYTAQLATRAVKHKIQKTFSPHVEYDIPNYDSYLRNQSYHDLANPTIGAPSYNPFQNYPQPQAFTVTSEAPRKKQVLFRPVPIPKPTRLDTVRSATSGSTFADSQSQYGGTTGLNLEVNVGPPARRLPFASNQGGTVPEKGSLAERLARRREEAIALTSDPRAAEKKAIERAVRDEEYGYTTADDHVEPGTRYVEIKRVRHSGITAKDIAAATGIIPQYQKLPRQPEGYRFAVPPKIIKHLESEAAAQKKPLGVLIRKHNIAVFVGEDGKKEYRSAEKLSGLGVPHELKLKKVPNEIQHIAPKIRTAVAGRPLLAQPTLVPAVESLRFAPKVRSIHHTRELIAQPTLVPAVEPLHRAPKINQAVAGKALHSTPTMIPKQEIRSGNLEKARVKSAESRAATKEAKLIKKDTARVEAALTKLRKDLTTQAAPQKKEIPRGFRKSAKR